MRLNSRNFYMAPERIGFLRFILEAYDNLAVLTTIDQRHGQVILRYPDGLKDEVEKLLAALQGPLALSATPPLSLRLSAAVNASPAVNPINKQA